MGIKRLFTGLVTMCFVSFGAVPGAVSLSIEEFDSLMSHQQESFIETALHHYYYGYTRNSETIYMANCMVYLEKRIVEDGDTYLLSLIMRDLDVARSDDAKNHAVEGVIKAVINHECKTP